MLAHIWCAMSLFYLDLNLHFWELSCSATWTEQDNSIAKGSIILISIQAAQIRAIGYRHDLTKSAHEILLFSESTYTASNEWYVQNLGKKLSSSVYFEETEGDKHTNQFNIIFVQPALQIISTLKAEKKSLIISFNT